MQNEKIKVLILEDNSDDYEFELMSLKNSDFDVDATRVETKSDFIEELKKKEWDIIISDYNLPDINGLEAFSIMKEKNIDIPMVIVTGALTEEAAIACIEVGISNYVLKDNLARLGPAVRQAIEKNKLKDDRDKALEKLKKLNKELEQRVEERTKELKDKEERLRDLFENANDLIQSVGRDCKFQFVNKAWLDTLGYTESELENLSLFDILREDQISHCKEMFENISNGEKYDKVETVFVTKDGKEIIVEGNVNAYFKDGEFVATRAIFRDITERKKAEKELKETHQMLKIVNKHLERKVEERTSKIQSLLDEKDQFIGRLGHDLKTPLSILMNILPMIDDEVKNAETKEDIQVALRNVNFIKHIVKETLDIAEISNPHLVLDIKDVNLNTIVDEVISENTMLLKDKNIKVANLFDKEFVVPADEMKIKEVINNLITNALKFTPEDGKISVNANENDDGTITFKVIDTGIGMNEEQIQHVFDDFYKADKSRHDLGGSGLGLGISKRIIEKHDGEIWAESEGEGKGSSFCFKLKKEDKKKAIKQTI